MGQEHISSPIQELLEIFQQSRRDSLYPEDLPRIQVSQIMSHISFFYEKIRNVIDYNEEHLIRKNAIQRILKRRIRMLQKKDIGRSLVLELIRAKYLENNFLPENKIPEIETVIAKYLTLLELVSQKHGLQEKLRMHDWVLGIASCEIEERLNLLTRDNAMVNTMYNILKPRIQFRDQLVDQHLFDIQLYIAIHRSLIKSDQSILAFRLLNLIHKDFRSGSSEVIESVAQNIRHIKRQIDDQLRSPLGFRISRFLQRETVFFMILRDVMEKDEQGTYGKMLERPLFEEQVKTAASRRYQTTQNKLARSIVNSVIYIFLTKIILAFVLELPYEAFVLNEIHVAPLTINILFPPFLMFLIARSAKIPSSDNTKAIIIGVNRIVYGDQGDSQEYVFHPSAPRSQGKTFIFSLIYLLMFVVSFGTIVFVLRQLQFNIMSIALFLLFICVVSFFGIKIRNSVKELMVIRSHTGLLSSFVDFLFLPILSVGRWISTKFSKINIFAFALDFLIEAPLKLIIELVEDWFSFMKEKKEEIY